MVTSSSEGENRGPEAKVETGRAVSQGMRRNSRLGVEPGTTHRAILVSFAVRSKGNRTEQACFPVELRQFREQRDE
jgi:hypothetical protein